MSLLKAKRIIIIKGNPLLSLNSTTIKISHSTYRDTYLFPVQSDSQPAKESDVKVLVWRVGSFLLITVMVMTWVTAAVMVLGADQ